MRSKFFLCCFFVLIFILNSFNLSGILQAESFVVIVSVDEVSVHREASKESEVLQTFKLNDELCVLSEINGFFEVELNNNLSGFVLKAFCTPKMENLSVLSFNGNATMKNDSDLFFFENGEFKRIGQKVLKDERVCLLNGFDSAQTYSFVSILKDERVFYYYVETENVNPDGVDLRIIKSLALVVVGISLATLFVGLFIGKKKKIKRS